MLHKVLPASNDGRKIDIVLERTDCKKHKAQTGESCFKVYSGSHDRAMLKSVCGKRIHDAGFRGKISQTSKQLKRADASATTRKKY